MKILLAVDGTKQSEAATTMVGNFQMADGEVKIVSIIDMALPLAVEVHAGLPLTSAEIEETARQNAFKILETARQKVRDLISNENICVSTEVLFGSPDSRIVETAEAMNADLIIVGSHGYNRWERLLLGSVSDSVVHHAPCSVLVVRSPKS